MSETTLDPRLLELLRCPCPAHGELTYDVGVTASESTQTLTCAVCGRVFPVRDGIPVMLLDEALEPGSEGEPS